MSSTTSLTVGKRDKEDTTCILQRCHPVQAYQSLPTQVQQKDYVLSNDGKHARVTVTRITRLFTLVFLQVNVKEYV